MALNPVCPMADIAAVIATLPLYLCHTCTWLILFQQMERGKNNEINNNQSKSRSYTSKAPSRQLLITKLVATCFDYIGGFPDGKWIQVQFQLAGTIFI